MHYQRKLIIFSFIAFSSIFFSQSINETKIDSLKNLLKSVEEKEKGNILSKISELYVKIDPGESIRLGHEALPLLKKYNQLSLTGKTYISISTAQRYLNNTDSTEHYINLAFKVFEKIEDKYGIATANNALGTLNYNKGNFAEASKNYNAAISISEELKDSALLSSGVQGLANTYWYLGKFDKALENYLRSLALAEAKGERHIIAVALNNLALYYEYQDDFEVALKYHLKALEVKKDLGNAQSLSVTYMNLAGIYLELDEYDKSESHINKALQLLEETKNGSYLAYAYSTLSSINMERGQLPLAIKNLKTAIEFSKAGKSKWRTGSSLNELGALYLETNQIDLAEKAFNESLALAEETDAKQLMQRNYKDLSNVYLRLNQYQKASDNLLAYIDVTDSLFNKNKQEAMQEMATKYETEKKEQEIELLNKEKVLADITLDNEILLRNSFIGGTFTFLVIAVGLFNRYRYKSKTNKKLSDLNTKLTDLNDQLEDELNQAASYIESLLPPKISDKIKTDWMFIPSSQLGGDSFGYSWLSDSLFSFYLIDVSGHGVGAALLSTTVLNLLKSKTLPDAEFTDPSSVLNSLNKNFDMEEHEGKYFAIWYGVLDIITNELTCASAMHPPAMSVGMDGLLKLGKKDIMIGAFPEYDYKNTYYQLNKGDKLYLFSDGCFELENDTDGGLDFDVFAEIVVKESKSDNPLAGIFNNLSTINMSEQFGDDYSMLEIELTN